MPRVGSKRLVKKSLVQKHPFVIAELLPLQISSRKIYIAIYNLIGSNE